MGVFGPDRVFEALPALAAVKRVDERVGDRMAAAGEDLVWEVLAELAPQVPFALAVLDLLAEQVADVSASALSAVWGPLLTRKF